MIKNTKLNMQTGNAVSKNGGKMPTATINKQKKKHIFYSGDFFINLF